MVKMKGNFGKNAEKASKGTIKKEGRKLKKTPKTGAKTNISQAAI